MISKATAFLVTTALFAANAVAAAISVSGGSYGVATLNAIVAIYLALLAAASFVSER